MVRNFGEKRKKKAHKKFKGKGGSNGKDMEEVSSSAVAMYVPPEQREADQTKARARAEDSRSSNPRNTYRSKRMDRQRLKKDSKKEEGWGYVQDSEDEDDEDEDNLDFGGEYDEIIRTGPSRRAAREAREAEEMASSFASSTITFAPVGPRHARSSGGTSRRGRRGRARNTVRNDYGRDYGGFGGLIPVGQISMLDLLVMAIADRL